MVIDKLGIIAGGGHLPALLLAHCQKRGVQSFAIALEGFADHPDVFKADHEVIGLSRVGKIIKALKDKNCSHVCMIGPIKKPSLRSIIPDARGALLLPKLLGAAGQGDDALLRVVISELEGEGLTVLGIHEIMPGLLPKVGPLGDISPDEDAQADIVQGFQTAKHLGALDIGQAVIVQNQVVIGVEAVEGTDALLARCAPLMLNQGGGVLIKACKPQQERRADLPTIGLKTLEGVAEAGLKGIAIEAGRSLVVDRDAVRDRANVLGLFVIAHEPDTHSPEEATP